MMRNFRIIAHTGVGNTQRHDEIIGAKYMRNAADLFAEKHGGTVYSTREERTGADGLKVWSAGWSESGLRMWVYEQ